MHSTESTEEWLPLVKNWVVIYLSTKILERIWMTKETQLILNLNWKTLNTPERFSRNLEWDGHRWLSSNGRIYWRKNIGDRQWYKGEMGIISRKIVPIFVTNRYVVVQKCCTGIPGLWTQVLDAGLWMLDVTLRKLGSGHWTLLLTGSEQNQNTGSDPAWLNHWKFIGWESPWTPWSCLFYRQYRF